MWTIQFKMKQKPNVRWEVVIVPDKIMGNYWGMNEEAARAVNWKVFKIKRNQIAISDKVKGKRVRKIIQHEKVEYHNMRDRNQPYEIAHKGANAFEWHSWNIR
jgi:hypothetical protein